MKIGLRVDLDTFNGTRTGFPSLLDLLDRRGIRASFFFSVGPDNMGRHIRRLFRPAFLAKMVRSKAAGLYGWESLLRGTFYPGPLIFKTLSPHIQRAEKAGHEIGLHAWDHHRWQSRVGRMKSEEITRDLARGRSKIAELTGKPPVAFAAPAWRATGKLLEAERTLKFRYGSDCRGAGIFLPVLEDRRPGVPQVPVTLPTFDEVVGRGGVTPRNYNEHLLSLVSEGGLNVLTVHAEVEGRRYKPLFEEFIREVEKRGGEFATLGSLIPPETGCLPEGAIGRGTVPGREGWLAVQK